MCGVCKIGLYIYGLCISAKHSMYEMVIYTEFHYVNFSIMRMCKYIERDIHRCVTDILCIYHYVYRLPAALLCNSSGLLLVRCTPRYYLYIRGPAATLCVCGYSSMY